MLVLKLFLNEAASFSVHGSSDVHSANPINETDGSEYILHKTKQRLQIKGMLIIPAPAFIAS